ncbi:zinc finger protein 236 [Drosophila novamexicana]|uniref:zinc finger protein 236 n=1 Tax=Drosophila novamexicana TaxID=47314 RepID=UPI0011E5B093|nr:zinc finger protein 236 [Drosophila novamexicana]
MNIDLRKLCRICFVDNADIDITQHKVVTASQTIDADAEEEEHTICEIMQAIFHISLDLSSELPMICNACLEECLMHYAYFSKLMIANRQLRQLYNEAQLEREQLELEVELEGDVQLIEVNVDEQSTQQDPEQMLLDLPRPSQRLANEDSLIVSEFLPATELHEQEQAEMDQNLSHFPSYELRTLDYAAVELKHDNLDEYNETNRLLDSEPSGSQAIYKCKYCPLAYASQQFLKTHVRRSHVCKYCTTAFVKVKELNAHIRDKHANSHQCVVCLNSFSTSSNLRAHLKRMHGVQLPAQVALLDYRPAHRENGQRQSVEYDK